MTILSVNNLTKYYEENVILDDISFHVNIGDRVGIVGRNGEGKTTLLKVLTGEENYDSGEIYFSNKNIGYLKQRDNFISHDTVLNSIDKIFKDIHDVENEISVLTSKIDISPDENDISKLLLLQKKLQDMGGYTYKSEINGVLLSMGFDESYYDKRIDSLSGGERTRLALASLLLSKPDILLLDEPTNHLDIDTLKWLESYLDGYKGTILVVSHDRYFLDRIVNRIFDLRRHKLKTYEGNYSDYVIKRNKDRENEEKAYQVQQKEIKRQEEIIRVMMEHNTEHLVKRAQSRMKRLDMIERVDKPDSELKSMKFGFKEDFKSGNDVLMLENVSKKFYDLKLDSTRELFNNVNMDLKRGEKICIVGSNGVGKTTLLKIILGLEEKNSGRVRVGHNVEFGYYDQGQLLLNENNTLLEELKDEFRMYSDTEMRKILGRFLFTNDDVFLKIRDLSGGEKARLSLCKLMLSKSNTLILDEPTNHLDIESKEVFEEALLSFPGTCIIVSHDRYFLKKIPNRILELTPNGIIEYLGNYDYYLEKKDERNILKVKHEEEKISESNLKRLQDKDIQKEERRRKRKIEETEMEISKLEDEISKVESEIALPINMSDYEKLGMLSTKLDELRRELNTKYELWESLM